MKTNFRIRFAPPLNPPCFRSQSLLLAGGILAAITIPVRAQITVDGTLDSAYGVPLATQTINTGFGDSSYTGTPNGPDANGSELDAAYGLVSGGNFYLFLAGNIQNNGNHLNVFIADGQAGGQNTLNISGSPTEAAMNGSVFSPGFNANLMLDLNDYQGTLYVDQVTLSGSGGTASYLGGIPLSAGIGSGTLGGIAIGLNNSNTGGVNGSAGTAANQTAADAVTTGIELGIPLSQLGNPTGSILALADINGGGDGYLSDQFLPGLAVGTGNIGAGGASYGVAGKSGAFDLNSVPNGYVAVPIPEPSMAALLGLAGLWSLLPFRRRG